MARTLTLMGLWALLLASTHAHGAIDMKTSNYTETWVDLFVQGTGYDLRVQRTYNSRVIFNGIFGFGMCSDFETKLEVTAEGNIKVTECGAGAEIHYSTKNFDPNSVTKTITTIVAEVKKKNPSMSEAALREIEKDLRADEFFRETFARRLGIRGNVEKEAVYFANGRENETMTRQADGFKRQLSDASYQLFDSQGRLTHMYDRSGNYLKLIYEKNLLTAVTDNHGRRLTFSYDKQTNKVARVTGPNSLKAVYQTEGDNLVGVTNAVGQKYSYVYDDVHNIVQINLPNGRKKSLTYNKDKDWVTSFTDESGCIESYDYKIDEKDPRGHFWSNVTKVCGDKVTNKSVYEFFHALRKDGTGLYLKKVKSDINGEITEIVYHEVFGKPVSIKRGDSQIEYTFSESGLIRTKTEPNKRLTYSYERTCNKASQIETEYLERTPASSKGKAQAEPKVVKKLVTRFSYDTKKCLLLRAENSDGQRVSLAYDVRGRVETIEDQSKKILKIKYDPRINKPEVLTRPGLGTVKLFYKQNGEIDRAESPGNDPRVASQILSVFSNLLEVIAPVGAEVNI